MKGSSALVVFALGALAACSSTPTASITLSTGDEGDAFSRAPAPTSLLVEAVGLDGVATELARTALPTDTISLGDRARTDVTSLRVTARDGAGNVVVRGASLFFQYGALENTDFSVFVQRTGELARMPRAPAALDAPVAVIAVDRYVLMASGTSSFLYDLLLLRTLGHSPTLKRPARSVVAYETYMLAIDENGMTTIDLTNDVSVENEPPGGGTFGDVSGGVTIAGNDGASYVVGGTRSSGEPTTRILVVSKEGKASFANLGVARRGACATYVDGRGLVVYGGAATGAGAEVLATGATTATPLPYAADPVTGCGASALTPSHILVAGGSLAGAIARRPGRVLDLACTKDCAPFPWPNDIALARASVVTLTPEAAVVAGDDATGGSLVFRISSKDSRPIPLKVPRKGAQILALPMPGQLAVIGGAPAIEAYVE